jgi:NADPH-dependent curcumin reductase CurA
MEAVRNRMNVRDRVVRCGLIPGYTKEDPALSSFGRVRMKGLSVRGFMISNYAPRFLEATKQLGKRRVMGKLKDRQLIVKGLEIPPCHPHAVLGR